MAVHYDRSVTSIVAWCDCGWRDLCLTQEAAWAIAEEHEQRVHPARFQVRDAAAKRAERTRGDRRPGMSG